MDSPPSSSGKAKDIMSSGKTSGTPPTRVLTTYSPAQAPSRIALPKASVKEVLRNIEPRMRTYSYECVGVRRLLLATVRLISTYIPHVLMPYRAKESDSILEHVLFAHLK